MTIMPQPNQTIDLANRIGEAVAREFEKLSKQQSGGNSPFGKMQQTGQVIADQQSAQADSQMTLTRHIRESSRALLGFTQHLINIPRSPGALVAQSLQAGSPQSMSTLKKSFDLVLGEITGIFIPAIARASLELQKFAGWLKKNEGSKELEVGKSALIGGIAAWFMPGGAIAKTLAFGITGLFDMWRKTNNNKKTEQKMRAETQKLYDLSEAKKDQLMDIRGGKHGQKLQDHFSKKENVWQDFSKMPKEIQDLLKGQGIDKAFRDHETQLNFDHKRNKAKMGGEGGKPLIDNPPGYQANFSTFADVRRNLQVSSLGMSPLDRMKMEQEQRNWQKMFQYMEKISRDGDLGIPPNPPA